MRERPDRSLVAEPLMGVEDSILGNFDQAKKRTPPRRRRRVQKTSGEDTADDSSTASSTESEDEFQYHILRHLSWDDSNLWKILTQTYGSVWPRVLPFCWANMFWTVIVWCSKHYWGWDFTVAPSGHKYTASLMSFLLVTRLKILYDRYMQNAQSLAILFKSCRDLVANICVLTANETKQRAKQWRQDVAYSVLILVRVSVAVLEFRHDPALHPWRLPEFLQEYEQERYLYSFDDLAPRDPIHLQRYVVQHDKDGTTMLASPIRPKPNENVHLKRSWLDDDFNPTMRSIIPDFSTDLFVDEEDGYDPSESGFMSTRSMSFGEEDGAMDDDSRRSSFYFDAEMFDAHTAKRELAHLADEARVEMEEACRLPINVMSLIVENEIMKQRDGTWFERRDLVWDHPCNEETRLLDMVGDMVKSFSGLYKNITTPIPFPLVQMTKTFLFVWLYTVPLALVHERYNRSEFDHPLIPMVLTFMITFGFLGLEFVSVEMTDTFGHDPSDFDALGHSQIAMEDCYLSIYQQDGKDWADALRKRLRLKQS